MSNPRFAVVIPAYNQPAFLREALTSLCDQGLKREEYVVAICDDASPTPLTYVIDEFRDRLQIVFHRQERNVGHLVNWDTAWQLVDVPFVSFLSHDDVVAPGHFARALAALEGQDDDVVLLSSLVLCQNHPGALKTHQQGVLLRSRDASWMQPYRWGRAEWMALSMVETPSSLVGSLLRTDAFRKCRIWTSYAIWHDRLMVAEMGLHGSVMTLPWIAGTYRTGDWQLSGLIWQTDMSEFHKASGEVRAWCAANDIDVMQFWIDHICQAPTDRDRLMYLQMVRSAVDVPTFDAVRKECETRLNKRLPIGRLERLGVPAPVAAALRYVDRQLLAGRP
ncbi:MAG: glycosyltransferase [Cyanobacteria bacterium]|nr:glycosyltransferase [Cyanobacteriota bacterium]